MSVSSCESDAGSICSDDSDYNFIPGYYRPIESRSEDSESQASDLENDEFVDGDACTGPYSDEPLADEEWTKKYKEEQEEKQRRLESLKDRLSGKESLSNW